MKLSSSLLALELLATLVYASLSPVDQAEGCGGKPADVMFVLDASSSIYGPDFDKQLEFVNSVTQEFDIRPTRTRCGLLTFSDYVHEEFRLSTYTNRRSLSRGIRSTYQIRGGTRTDKALLRMRQLFESEARPGVPKVAVVMTDGKSEEYGEQTREEARLCREAGITVLSIGIGESIDIAELRAVASAEEFLFTVDSYDALEGIRDLLAVKACSVEDPMLGDQSGGELDSPLSKGCDGKPSDVVFALDASSSIWLPDFERQLSFVRDVVGIFQISPLLTRIGVLTFGDLPESQFHLGEYASEAEVEEAIGEIKQTGGDVTNTAAALQSLADDFFAPESSRDGVVKIGVVITDGRSHDSARTRLEADRAKRAGIHMFAIGVGRDVDHSELLAMASQPAEQYVFTADTYEALDSIKLLLAMKTCSVTVPPTTTTTQPTTTTTTTTTTTRPPITECGVESPADVVFALPDGANAYQSGYGLRFVRDVSSSLNLGKDRVHLGLLPKTCYSVEGVKLRGADKQTLDKDNVLRQFRSNGRMPVDVANVVKHLCDVSFAKSRAQAQKIAVLVLDKSSRNFENAYEEARRARDEHGINLLVVTVGDHIPVEKANSLATAPAHRHVFTAKSWRHLPKISAAVSQAINDFCSES